MINKRIVTITATEICSITEVETVSIRLKITDDELFNKMSGPCDNGAVKDILMERIKAASKEYCLSEEGKKVFEGNCDVFNLGDFDTNVPNDICRKHGFEKEDPDGAYVTADLYELLVNEDEIFPRT